MGNELPCWPPCPIINARYHLPRRGSTDPSRNTAVLVRYGAGWPEVRKPARTKKGGHGQAALPLRRVGLGYLARSSSRRSMATFSFLSSSYVPDSICDLIAATLSARI